MRALFIIFIFSFFFTDCASKGIVSPLTYHLDMGDDDLFADIDDRVCDLTTLRPVTATSLTISGASSDTGFSQQIDYKLYCQDSLKDKKGDTVIVDLIDSLFEYYKNEVFRHSVEQDGESFRDSFFLFVRFFQKNFFIDYPDEDAYDRVKLLKEDVVINRFIQGISEDQNKVIRKIKRTFWTSNKFPVVGEVSGFIETIGTVSIEKKEEGETKVLIITYKSDEKPKILGGGRSKNSSELENTLGIKEHVEMKYTPSQDHEKPNFFVTVKREDNAVKPAIASTSLGASHYEKCSRKVFEKVIFSSAIEHYSHLARYLILQSPAGFRGVMHTKIMNALKILAGQGKENSKILVKSKSNQKEVEIDISRSDKWVLTATYNNQTKKLEMDVSVPETSFSSKNGESFLASIAIPNGMDDFWSEILGVEKETDQLNLPIKVEDGLLKLMLFRNQTNKQKKKENGTHDWITLSRPVLYNAIKQVIKKSTGSKVKHRPYDLEIEFKEDDQLFFKTGEKATEYIFKFKVDEKEFIEGENSFALILTSIRNTPSPELIKNLSLEISQDNTYKGYIKFDPEDGILLRKKKVEKEEISWSSMLLTKETQFEGHEEYENLMSLLKTYTGSINYNKNVKITWDRNNKITFKNNQNESASSSYEVLENSFYQDDASFTLRLSFESQLPVWLSQEFQDKTANQKKDIRIKSEVEDKHPHLFFHKHPSLHSVIKAKGRWLDFSRKEKLKKFKEDIEKIDMTNFISDQPRKINIQVNFPNQKTTIVFSEQNNVSNNISCTVESLDEHSYKPGGDLSFKAKFNCKYSGYTINLTSKLGLLNGKRRLKQEGEDFLFELPNFGKPSNWILLTKETPSP